MEWNSLKLDAILSALLPHIHTFTADLSGFLIKPFGKIYSSFHTVILHPLQAQMMQVAIAVWTAAGLTAPGAAIDPRLEIRGMIIAPIGPRLSVLRTDEWGTYLPKNHTIIEACV